MIEFSKILSSIKISVFPIPKIPYLEWNDGVYIKYINAKAYVVAFAVWKNLFFTKNPKPLTANFSIVGCKEVSL